MCRLKLLVYRPSSVIRYWRTRRTSSERFVMTYQCKRYAVKEPVGNGGIVFYRPTEKMV